MYRWQNPPILPSAYASAAFSSKRRMSSICRSILRCSSVCCGERGGGARSVSRTWRSRSCRCCLHLLPRVIAGPDQRARFDMPESERHAVALELGEFVRRVPARDGQMLIRRPQVLADGENVDAGRAEIAQRREQLVPFLAQAADDPGLRQQLGIHVLGAVEELQGPRVAATRPRDAVQPGNRFEVVIEDV